jgi:hypothetical protein
MTLLRMDNVLIVVDDLKAAIAFFAELGLELEGQTTVEGQWVDRVVGLDGGRSDIGPPCPTRVAGPTSTSTSWLPKPAGRKDAAGAAPPPTRTSSASSPTTTSASWNSSTWSARMTGASATGWCSGIWPDEDLHGTRPS